RKRRWKGRSGSKTEDSISSYSLSLPDLRTRSRAPDVIVQIRPALRFGNIFINPLPVFRCLPLPFPILWIRHRVFDFQRTVHHSNAFDDVELVACGNGGARLVHPVMM